jgi:hypothetical protein
MDAVGIGSSWHGAGYSPKPDGLDGGVLCIDQAGRALVLVMAPWARLADEPLVNGV